MLKFPFSEVTPHSTPAPFPARRGEKQIPSAGYYAHIHRAGKHKPDVICGHEAFAKYLTSESKTVLHEIEIDDITDRHAAVMKLKDRLASKYFWGATTHNCAEWAATIVQAGGSKYTAKCWLPSEMTKDEFQDPGDRGGAYQKLHT